MKAATRLAKPRIIPTFAGPWETGAWQAILRDSIRSPTELMAAVGVDHDAIDCDPNFPLRVPRPFVERIRHGDPSDPLLRQVLPTKAERRDAVGVADPLGEAAATKAPGLIQKYAGRALLIATPACAVHCRYCFRREFPYADHPPDTLSEAIATIAEDAEISEVILSGGDPLSVTDERLAELLGALDRVEHVRRVRIHTRVPVVIPQRVSVGLVDLLTNLHARLSIVMHVNHANELDTLTERAFRCLADAGATLLNQAVLLAGVNNSTAAQADLAERLFDQQVLPYYLHLLDPVRGASHFDVPECDARHIMAGLGARLPGYLVPRLVREVPGAPSKVLLTTRETDARF